MQGIVDMTLSWDTSNLCLLWDTEQKVVKGFCCDDCGSVHEDCSSFMPSGVTLWDINTTYNEGDCCRVTASDSTQVSTRNSNKGKYPYTYGGWWERVSSNINDGNSNWNTARPYGGYTGFPSLEGLGTPTQYRVKVSELEGAWAQYNGTHTLQVNSYVSCRWTKILRASPFPARLIVVDIDTGYLYIGGGSNQSLCYNFSSCGAINPYMGFYARFPSGVLSGLLANTDNTDFPDCENLCENNPDALAHYAPVGMDCVSDPWTSLTDYFVGDEVLSLVDRCYSCIVEHTSGLTDWPGVGADWQDFWIRILN